MTHSLGDALFTTTQKKVLGLLYGKPDESFFTNEIVRWAKVGKGSVVRGQIRLFALCPERRNLAEYEGYMEVDEALLAEMLTATDHLLVRVEQAMTPK